MARARFTGPPNPDPDGAELGHEVPLLGRTVHPDELADMPGDLVEELTDGWLLGDPADETNRYVLPKGLWLVEDQPVKATKKTRAAEPAKAEGN